MKRIVCEMCGDTDIIKQDGVFICQTCGTKYSLEEAKKMMIEIEGTVKIQNAAQLENLLNLAHSSFDSKNYAKAEDFCNQVIAMDDKNYDAWKLKGESINNQISSNNPRIEEVFNCILTAFRVLSNEEKVLKKEELLKSIRNCLEGEVIFWVHLVEKNRPSATTVGKVKTSYIDSKQKIIKALVEFGMSEKEVRQYVSEFNNKFINEVCSTVSSAWKTTVGYNYYRDDFGCLGSRWIVNNFHNIDFRTDEYRPTEAIFNTFIKETDCLIELLQEAEKYFNEDTSEKVMETIFSNIAFFEDRLVESYAFKLDYGCASTWDTSSSLGWRRYISLSEVAKKSRKSIASNYREKERKIPEEVKKCREAKRERERQERIKNYWELHQEEKKLLESEQAELKKKINALDGQIALIDSRNRLRLEAFRKERDKALPSELEEKKQESVIRALEMQRDRCGIFKGKQKKEIQARIDNQETPKLNELKMKAESDRINHNNRLNVEIGIIESDGKDIRDEAASYKRRYEEITLEFTKDR